MDTLSFLDETRVGVWGWGFGGYVTSMILGSQQNVFKCGVAVSPISDWLYYSEIPCALLRSMQSNLDKYYPIDSAFTERILGLPSENYKGYVEADATQRAKQIPSQSFFLIHGLADATAPYQHGIELARALTEAGTIFRYQVRVKVIP